MVKNRIRELRNTMGITQVELAKALRITRQTVIAIEKGRYNPSLELALKISQYFQVPMERIFYLEEEN